MIELNVQNYGHDILPKNSWKPGHAKNNLTEATFFQSRNLVINSSSQKTPGPLYGVTWTDSPFFLHFNLGDVRWLLHVKPIKGLTHLLC